MQTPDVQKAVPVAGMPDVQKPIEPLPAVEAKKTLKLNDKKEEPTKELKGNFGMSTKSGMQKFMDALSGFGLGREKIHFVENLAILLNSGLTVVDALKTILVNNYCVRSL